MTNECHDLKSAPEKFKRLEKMSGLFLAHYNILNSSRDLSRLFDTVFEICPLNWHSPSPHMEEVKIDTRM